MQPGQTPSFVVLKILTWAVLCWCAALQSCHFCTHAWLSYRNYFQHLSQKWHLSRLLSWNECVFVTSLENLFLSLIQKPHLCYRNNCTQWHSVPSLEQHGEWFAVLGNWSQHKPTGFCNLSIWCLWFKHWTHCISTSGQPELGTLLQCWNANHLGNAVSKSLVCAIILLIHRGRQGINARVKITTEFISNLSIYVILRINLHVPTANFIKNFFI